MARNGSISFLARCIAAAGLALAASAAVAQAGFPAKTIHLIVPFPAGGGTDLLARPLAVHMSKTLGATVVVDNKPGGAGMIGAGYVARAQPDGYNLLITVGSPIVVNPSVFKKMPYDSEKDFAGIAEVSSMPVAIAVQKSSPVNSLADLARLYKSGQASGSFASTGLGSASHILGEAVNRQLGLDLVHVPYQGSAPAVTAALGGHATVVYADMAAIAAQVDGGKLKVLAVTGSQRGRNRPDMKTFEEQGVKKLGSSWVGVFAPAGTPPAVVEKLSAAVVSAVRSKEINDIIVKGGMEPTGLPAAAMDQRLQGDIANWRELVRSIGGVTVQ